jgi:hypothetical protein
MADKATNALIRGTTFETKDNGMRRTAPTGAMREQSNGKGRFDLISPKAMRRLAQLYERGAAKYAESNMRLGQPLKWYLDSCERHLNSFKDGDRSEDHLAAVMWNAAEAIHLMERCEKGELPAELLELPP